MNKTNGVYNVLLAYLVLIQLIPEYCKIAALKCMKNGLVRTKVCSSFQENGKRIFEKNFSIFISCVRNPFGVPSFREIDFLNVMYLLVKIMKNLPVTLRCNRSQGATGN